MASRDRARIHWHMGCQEEVKAQSVSDNAISCSGVSANCLRPARPCGKQRRPDLKHINTLACLYRMGRSCFVLLDEFKLSTGEA